MIYICMCLRIRDILNRIHYSCPNAIPHYSTDHDIGECSYDTSYDEYCKTLSKSSHIALIWARGERNKGYRDYQEVKCRGINEWVRTFPISTSQRDLPHSQRLQNLSIGTQIHTKYLQEPYYDHASSFPEPSQPRLAVKFDYSHRPPQGHKTAPVTQLDLSSSPTRAHNIHSVIKPPRHSSPTPPSHASSFFTHPNGSSVSTCTALNPLPALHPHQWFKHFIQTPRNHKKVHLHHSRMLCAYVPRGEEHVGGRRAEEVLSERWWPMQSMEGGIAIDWDSS
jgi:hypothetical protein